MIFFDIGNAWIMFHLNKKKRKFKNYKKLRNIRELLHSIIFCFGLNPPHLLLLKDLARNTPLDSQLRTPDRTMIAAFAELRLTTTQQQCARDAHLHVDCAIHHAGAQSSQSDS